MENNNDVALIIPSRIGSSRLARKPLELIGNKTMIEMVFEQVKKTGVNHVYVATDSQEIVDTLKHHGDVCIMTDESCVSGTLRVAEAFNKIRSKHNFNYVLNIQGDMPFVEPATILEVIAQLKAGNYDVMTPVVKVTKDLALGDSNVKVVVNAQNKALYFSRSMIPFGAEQYLYHVGIYGFSSNALTHFVNLPKTELESQENLEQLRALYHGMDIGICYVNSVPISVDTKEDLEKAKNYYSSSN